MAPLRHARHILTDTMIAARQGAEPGDTTAFARWKHDSSRSPTTSLAGNRPERRPRRRATIPGRPQCIGAVANATESLFRAS